MFGVALRLLAAGQASRRLGDYVKKLAARYIILSIAGITLLVALGFAVSAGFWGFLAWTGSPIWAALIMTGILLFVALLIALTAYGTTRSKPESARQAVKQPLGAVAPYVPTVEDVGREIQAAVHRYGPLRVTAAAAAGGIVAGLLARRFSQPRIVYKAAPAPIPPTMYEPVVETRRNGRRWANGRRHA